MKIYLQTQIQINVREGKENNISVYADVYTSEKGGQLAIHDSYKFSGSSYYISKPWTISHVGTGKRIISTTTKRGAQYVMRQILNKCSWDFYTASDMNNVGPELKVVYDWLLAYKRKHQI